MTIKKCKLFKKEKAKKVRCAACSHRCLISEGKTGICGVRKNIGGELFLLVYGRVAAEHIDPIEKKPLYRFLPGSKAFSIGTVGCNFKCDWCQNFDISQASKADGKKEGIIFGEERTAQQIADEALASKCESIAYTYNEPAIWSEYAKDIAALARKKKIHNVLVTNGYFTPEALQYLGDLIDAANVDLKSFSEKTYQKFCGAKLKNVLACIRWMHTHGVHVEITTLIIPGLNDSESELKKIAKFIFSLDKKGNVPWHISRFFPMYRMKEKHFTHLETLQKAYEIGKKAGLKYVFIGNI